MLSCSKQVCMFLVFVTFHVLVGMVLGFETVVVDKLPNYRTIELSSVVGPESLAFDPKGEGPYTGVSDGRVLKWMGEEHGWVEFAVPPRHRNVTKRECDGTTNTSMEDKCGRPLGLQFDKATGKLYIADAYFGLLVVGPRGGVSTPLAKEAEGLPFMMTNGLDVDQGTGIVFFTDSSTQFQRRDWVWSVLTRDATGRFMAYNPRTKEVKVLLRNLEFPNGVAISKDNTFILIGESTRQRVLRYWLKGPKAGDFDVFANVTGYPDNIRKNQAGEFWIATNTGKGEIHDNPLWRPDDVAAESSDTVGMRMDREGKVLEVLNNGNVMNPVSEVVENNGTLWLGSAVTPFVALFQTLSV